MKLFKKKSNSNDDFLAQEAKEEAATAADYTLDIPDDEIWSYQIEGLQAPAINKSYKKATGKKLLVIVILLIAISCSIFLSVRAVHRAEFDYKQLDDSSYQLTKYSNPGEATEVTVDYVDGDKSKPVSTIYEYAFNCDEKLTQITIGKDVKSIDAKAIYSCWALQNIYVDDDNPYYCDLDGVLYNTGYKPKLSFIRLTMTGISASKQAMPIRIRTVFSIPKWWTIPAQRWRTFGAQQISTTKNILKNTIRMSALMFCRQR